MISGTFMPTVAAADRGGGAEVLPMWVVTENPSDFPGRFVARKWEVARGSSMATAEHLVGGSLEEVRGLLPAWLTRIPPSGFDDPVIVEIWL